MIEMQERLAARLEAMLSELPPDQREATMMDCETILENGGIATGNPSRKTPRGFSRSLFLSNPSVAALVAKTKDLNPNNAESPQDLILALLPSNGHLD